MILSNEEYGNFRCKVNKDMLKYYSPVLALVATLSGCSMLGIGGGSDDPYKDLNYSSPSMRRSIDSNRSGMNYYMKGVPANRSFVPQRYKQRYKYNNSPVPMQGRGNMPPSGGQYGYRNYGQQSYGYGGNQKTYGSSNNLDQNMYGSSTMDQGQQRYNSTLYQQQMSPTMSVGNNNNGYDLQYKPESSYIGSGNYQQPQQQRQNYGSSPYYDNSYSNQGNYNNQDYYGGGQQQLAPYSNGGNSRNSVDPRYYYGSGSPEN